MYKLICISSVFLLCSCATVFNKKHTRLEVYSTDHTKIVFNKDTMPLYKGSIFLYPERKNQAISLILFNDSLTKTIYLKPKNSFAYWLNGYPGPTFIYGFFVDKNRNKRYTYPKRIYINLKDTVKEYTRHDFRNKKNQFHLNISIPYVNSFLQRPNNEINPEVNTGFLGLSLGLDYFYKEKTFISLRSSVASDFPAPVPAPVDYFGDHKNMSSTYISVSNNNEIKNLSIGYGLCYASNNWTFTDRLNDSTNTVTVTRIKNKALGFVFNTYYKAGRNFYCGIIYRPTFYRFLPTHQFRYEHLITLDLTWKIILNK